MKVHLVVALALVLFAAPSMAQEGNPAEGCFLLTDREGTTIQLTSVQDVVVGRGVLILSIASGRMEVGVAKIASMEFGAWGDDIDAPVPGTITLMDGTSVPMNSDPYQQWEFSTLFGEGTVFANDVKSLARCP